MSRKNHIDGGSSHSSEDARDTPSPVEEPLYHSVKVGSALSEGTLLQKARRLGPSHHDPRGRRFSEPRLGIVDQQTPVDELSPVPGLDYYARQWNEKLVQPDSIKLSSLLGLAKSLYREATTPSVELKLITQSSIATLFACVTRLLLLPQKNCVDPQNFYPLLFQLFYRQEFLSGFLVKYLHQTSMSDLSATKGLLLGYLYKLKEHDDWQGALLNYYCSLNAKRRVELTDSVSNKALDGSLLEHVLHYQERGVFSTFFKGPNETKITGIIKLFAGHKESPHNSLTGLGSSPVEASFFGSMLRYDTD